MTQPTPEQYRALAGATATVVAAYRDLAAALHPIMTTYAQQASSLYQMFQSAGLIDDQGKPTIATPAQPAPDPRQPAWDAVFAYIRTLPREGERPTVVERNAIIWRAVNAALVAVGYPDENERPMRQRPTTEGGTP